MSHKTHPWIDTVKVGALVFAVSVLIIVFLALYVAAETRDSQTVAPARAEKNIAPPGRLHLR